MHNDLSGDWRGLDSPAQRVRYAAIERLLALHVHAGSSVLDVGCGEAILGDFLQEYRYTGIEPSSIAAAHARARTGFPVIETTAEGFVSANPEQYDCIVFNEVLYYSMRPVHVVKKYASLLRPGGTILISIYLKPERRDWLRRVIARIYRRRFTNIECAKAIRQHIERKRWHILEHIRVPVPATSPVQYWEMWVIRPRPRGAPTVQDPCRKPE